MRVKNLVFIFPFFFAGSLICSCSHAENYSTDCSDDVEVATTHVDIIPVEDAIERLNQFLSEVDLTKTKSGNERTISSIETHFSDFVLTKSGEQMPDAYLINFNNDDGFAILGANTSITPIIAAVETGNTSWNKVLIPVNKMPVDGTDTDNDEEEEEDLSYMEALGPGLESDQILSLCVSSALYTKSGEERSGASSGSGTSATPSKIEVLPLLTKDLFFDQNVTYCHKSYNRIVTNGCASTALSMILAYKKYPQLTVDHELLDYSQCGNRDGLGIHYEFYDDEFYLNLNDYFKNSDFFPTMLSTDDMQKLLLAVDNKVIKKHGIPTIHGFSLYFRTRFKLTSSVFYCIYNIVKSWDGTGATPDAVKNGMKKLGFISISKESRTHLTDSHIKTITEMLNKKNPVLICGWSLFELSKSHYWIIDGIRSDPTETLIHCVWGHGNANIGWYASDCISSDITPVTTKSSGNNKWQNFVVFSYDIDTITPSLHINDFYDKHRVYYN